ncbi:MAG: hypothetical protein ACRCZF_20725 [Gemmataceae bacterium]
MTSPQPAAPRGDLREAYARLNATPHPRDWIELCQLCLAAEADDRPADANVVATLVRELRQTALEQARTLELKQAGATIRRNWFVCSAFVIGVLLLVGLILESHFARKAIEANDRAQQKSQDLEQSLVVVNQRTAQALDVYQQMITSIQDRLEPAPATQALRKELLQSARQG